jgi:hypothetical protein
MTKSFFTPNTFWNKPVEFGNHEHIYFRKQLEGAAIARVYGLQRDNDETWFSFDCIVCHNRSAYNVMPELHTENFVSTDYIFKCKHCSCEFVATTKGYIYGNLKATM